MTKSIRLSVKQLVDFSLQTGDLSHSSTGGPTAQEGISAHKKKQNSLRKTHQKEVSLSHTYQSRGLAICLSGRVDLLEETGEIHTLSEIKTTHVHPEQLSKTQRESAWSQAKVYGDMYLRKTGDEKLWVQVIWLDLISKTETTEEVLFAAEQLKAFTHRGIDIYAEFFDRYQSVSGKAVETAKALPFPFEVFRQGQKEMAGCVYRAVRDEQLLLVEAPTGIGKTMSALFPAVKAIGEKKTDQVVYLTAKNSGKKAAAQAIDKMAEQGLELSSIFVQSKQKTCFCKTDAALTAAKENDLCPYAVGFYDRLPDARLALFNTRQINMEVILSVAREHLVCPFELSLTLLPWVQVVVCDFNYVFDPVVCLGYFISSTRKMSLLIDEAHNLVDRARGMYSARFSRTEVKNAAAKIAKTNVTLGKKTTGIVSAIDRWTRSKEAPGEDVMMSNLNGSFFEEHISSNTPETITRAVTRFLDAFLKTEFKVSRGDLQVAEFLMDVFRYHVVEQLFEKHHRTLTRTSPKGHRKQTEVKLYCLNAADFLAQIYKQFKSVVLFSATLRPHQYYQKTLGLPKEILSICFASPFPPSNLGVFLCPYVDTRWKQRQRSQDALVQSINAIATARKGNYLVFFSSYAYMETIAEAFEKSFESVSIIKQERGSDELTRTAFLNQFSKQSNTLGFAIMGGVFGEGVDYVGDKLIGSIVVGPGLPQVGTEQSLIQEDFGNDGVDGFDYAFRYPGFARVLQTAGRVIRTETDTGVVVLLDGRFAQPFYRQLYPSHWQLITCKSAIQLSSNIQTFWTGFALDQQK